MATYKAKTLQAYSKNSQISTMPLRGLNNRVASEFQDLTTAQVMKNCYQDAEGVLIKIKDKLLEKNITTESVTITFLDKFDSNIWIFAYGTSAGAYNESLGTVNILKDDFGEGRFRGAKFKDYYYITNGTTKVQYFTYIQREEDYDKEAWVRPTFNVTVGAASGKIYGVYFDGDVLRFKGRAPAYVYDIENTSINFEVGNTYRVKSDAFGEFSRLQYTDPFDFDFVATGVGGLDKNFTVTNTNNLRVFSGSKLVSHNNQPLHSPSGTINGSNRTFTLNEKEYIDVDTISVDGVAFTGTFVIDGDQITLSVAPTTSFTFTGRTVSAGYTLDNISVKQVDKNFLEVRELVDSPICKTLFVYNDKLVAGGLVGNESFVYLSESFIETVNASPVPFTVWSGGSTPAEPKDPVQLPYSDFGDVNSLNQYGNQLLIYYREGRRGIVIDSIDDATAGVIQRVREIFKEVDAGGIESIKTEDGIYYNNEKGVYLSAPQFNSNFQDVPNDLEITESLSKDFISRIDFSNSYMVYEKKRNLLFISCDLDGQRTVLLYNTGSKAWSEIPYYNVYAMFSQAGDIYGCFEGEASIYKLLSEATDNTITMEIEQEMQIPIDGMNRIDSFLLKGEWNDNSLITISFDIYDINRNLKEDVFTYTIGTGGILIESTIVDELGNIVVDESGNIIIGQEDYNKDEEERSFKFPVRFESFTRLIVKIKEESKVPMKLTYYKPVLLAQGENKTYTNA